MGAGFEIISEFGDSPAPARGFQPLVQIFIVVNAHC
jgi:hypothetical protein